MVRPHKTKIICTIGPASESPDVLKEMALAGMDIARLNFSHGSFSDHARVIAALRRLSEEMGRPITLLADLPGPKLRIGMLSQEGIELEAGDDFTLTTESLIGDRRKVSVDFPELPQSVRPGDALYLNDGLIRLQVQEVQGREVKCTVVVGGELRSRKGLNLPDSDLAIETFTPKDKEWVRFAAEQGVDALSQSFVAKASDMEALRRFAADLGYHPFIVAKIERAAALRRLDEILEAADGIMIARGDLGVETPIEEIAVVQKDITRRANRLGKPVITATQMLKSMTESRLPTRAEATDVANAVLDGTDCVMLSEESAVGKYPVQATAMLAKIAAVSESFRPRKTVEELWGDPDPSQGLPPARLISLGVEACLRYGRFVAVFVPTRSGTSVRAVARFRPPVWVFGVSRYPSVCRHLQFSYGVCPVPMKEETVDWKGFIREQLARYGIKEGLVMLTEGPSPRHPDIHHRLEIIEL